MLYFYSYDTFAREMTYDEYTSFIEGLLAGGTSVRLLLKLNNALVDEENKSDG